MRTKLILAVLFLASFGFARGAFAATLSFGGGTQYAIGDTVSVPVIVSTSASAPLNAVSATVSFPKDTLELTALSKAGSIINLWSEEPSFSNANGTATFEGVVFNPGYSGASGTVITLVFKIKASGSAKLWFSSASVLANDGRGTNILDGTISKTFGFGPAVSGAAPTAQATATSSAGSGAVSPPMPVVTTPLAATSTPAPAVMKAAGFSMKEIVAMILGALLALGFIIALIASLVRPARLKREVSKGLTSAEKRVHTDLDLMKDDLGETRSVPTLREHLSAVEDDIAKSLDEVRKDVE